MAQNQNASAPTTTEPVVSGASEDLAIWNCSIEGTPNDNQWTVGEVFNLQCEGPTVALSGQGLTLKLPEQQIYTLHLLDVIDQTDNKVLFKVTSYRPGEHKVQELKITEAGVPKIQVEPFVFPVQSVIKDPGQKPYGPIMAFQIAYPQWLWITLVVSAIILVFGLLFRTYRRSQMRKVLEALKEHNTALGAFNQFNKDIRILTRENLFDQKNGWSQEQKKRYIESLDQIFRMYMLREFIVPALDWGDRLILKTIAKQDRRHFTQYSTDLAKLMAELKRAQKDQDKVQVHDCKQLTQMAQKVTQTIWRLHKGQS